MSVVACKITKAGFEMASDSITVRGNVQDKANRTNTVKLFAGNGLMMGSVGWAKESSLMLIFSSNHRPAGSTEKDVIEFLHEFAIWKNEKTGEYSIENDYLIGFNSKVFYVSNWFVSQVKKYEAIGAGESFALAVLHNGGSVQKAVETAIELSVYCEPPIVFMKG